MENLEDVPALLYSIFWQTKQMGFLKRIYEEVGIENWKLMIFLPDFKPGALIEFKKDQGDFIITPIYDTENITYDAAVIGELKYFLKLIKKHMLSRGLYYIIAKKIKFKGMKYLLKFLKLIGRLAI